VKIRATIEVEFQIEDGAPANAGNAALIRGKGALFHAIEPGVSSMPTLVKGGSTKVEIVKRDTIEE
jgi:hypothetical protein